MSKFFETVGYILACIMLILFFIGIPARLELSRDARGILVDYSVIENEGNSYQYNKYQYVFTLKHKDTGAMKYISAYSQYPVNLSYLDDARLENSEIKINLGMAWSRIDDINIIDNGVTIKPTSISSEGIK